MPRSVPSPKIVHGREPWRYLLPILLVLALPIVAWFAYQHGLNHSGASISLSLDRFFPVDVSVQKLREEKRELTQQLTILERASQIDREALTQVRAQLRTLGQETLRLREDLAFYKSIVVPEEGQQGLQIQNLRLQPGGNDSQRFHYEVVLTQALKNDSQIEGKLRFSIEGVLGSETKELPLAELSNGSVKEHSFKFRYFQKLDGTIQLPEGFVPLRVRVEATPNGRKDRVERSFDWPMTS